MGIIKVKCDSIETSIENGCMVATIVEPEINNLLEWIKSDNVTDWDKEKLLDFIGKDFIKDKMDLREF
jgi:hypothetical protein